MKRNRSVHEAVVEAVDRWRAHMRGCDVCVGAHRPAEYCAMGKSLVQTFRAAERAERIHIKAMEGF